MSPAAASTVIVGAQLRRHPRPMDRDYLTGRPRPVAIGKVGVEIEALHSGVLGPGRYVAACAQQMVKHPPDWSGRNEQ